MRYMKRCVESHAVRTRNSDWPNGVILAKSGGFKGMYIPDAV